MASTIVCRAQHPLGPRNQLPLLREGLCGHPPTKCFPASGLHRIGVAASASTDVSRAQHPLGPRDQLPLHTRRLVLVSTNQVLSRFRPPPDRGCCVGLHQRMPRPASTGPPYQLPLVRELLVLASTNRVISRSRPPPDRGCLPGSGIHRTGVRTPASTGPDQPS